MAFIESVTEAMNVYKSLCEMEENDEIKELKRLVLTNIKFSFDDNNRELLANNANRGRQPATLGLR